MEKWETEWQGTTKGRITKLYFPSIKQRLKVKFTPTHNTTVLTTGHGQIGAYLHRFKIIEDPTCICGKDIQTTAHILYECEVLKSERESLKTNITKLGGQWPANESDLVIKYTKLFNIFANNINLDSLKKDT